MEFKILNSYQILLGYVWEILVLFLFQKTDVQMNNCKIVLQKKSSVLIFDKSHQEFCCINNPGNHFLSASNNSFPYEGFKNIYGLLLQSLVF